MNMFPTCASQNLADRFPTHTEARGKFRLGNTSERVLATDSPYRIFGKAGVITIFAALNRLWVQTKSMLIASPYALWAQSCPVASTEGTSAFCGSIAVVIESRSGKQVSGANATRIVAAMADEYPFGDGSVCGCEDNSMGKALAKDAIARTLPRTLPLPATCGELDLCPESGGEGYVTLALHLLNSLHEFGGAMLRAVTSSAGAFCCPNYSMGRLQSACTLHRAIR